MNTTFIYFILFFPLIPICFKALLALDFSKMFKVNSSWQIRVLVLLLSVILSYLFSSAIVGMLERIYQLFS